MRPALHLTAPDGWPNDPLGVTWRDGEYHVFFQYVPGSREWTPACAWGHAAGPDLVDLAERPVAIQPDDVDRGCWSGDVLAAADGSSLMFYSSIGERDMDLSTVRVARARPGDWDRWDKQAAVLLRPPREDLRIFRDPVLLPTVGGCRLLVGAGYRDGTAAVLEFRSEGGDPAEAASWRYAGALLEHLAGDDDPVYTGSGWECPQLLDLGPGGVVALVVSAWDPDALHHVLAAVGTEREGRLDVESWQQLTYGPGHYAATAFRDAEDRRCLMFWIRGTASPTGEWVGALSIPWVVDEGAGRLRLAPHPDAVAAAGRAGVLGLDWRPDSGSRLDLRAADGSVAARLAAVAGDLVVSAGDRSVTAPLVAGSPVAVLVDGPVLEVGTGEALVGLPLVAGAPAVLPDDPRVRPW